MAGGAYIRIKDGNIEIHAPGTIEQKAAVHPFMGPTKMNYTIPRFVEKNTLRRECLQNAAKAGSHHVLR